MTRRFPLLASVLLSFVSPALAAPPPAPLALKAALAERALRFDAPVPVGGYGAPPRRMLPPTSLHLFAPARGYLDPIRAKALLLQQPATGKLLLFVSLDVVLLPAELRQEIVAQLLPMGFAEDQIFLSATHTHSGPGAFSRMSIWELSVLDFLDNDTRARFVRAVVESVAEAKAKLAPAQLFESNFQAQGLQVNRSFPGGPFDPNAHLLYVRAASGQWLGALVNFGVHGTTLGPENLFLSSDLPGSIERNMESALSALNPPGSRKPVALFVNADSGDVAPAGSGYDFVVKGGELFARQAMAAMGPTLRPVSPVWRSARVVMPLNTPYFRASGCEGDGFDAVRDYLARVKLPLSRLLPSTAILQKIELGQDIRMIAVPGEVTSALRLQLNAAAGPGAERDWFLGLTNEYLAYFVRQEDFDRGRAVENCLSLYGPEGGRILQRSYLQLLRTPAR